MKIKINNVAGYSGTLTVKDVDGVPVEKFWRNRLKDAKNDNCVEVIKPSATRTKEKDA